MLQAVYVMHATPDGVLHTPDPLEFVEEHEQDLSRCRLASCAGTVCTNQYTRSSWHLCSRSWKLPGPAFECQRHLSSNEVAQTIASSLVDPSDGQALCTASVM